MENMRSDYEWKHNVLCILQLKGILLALSSRQLLWMHLIMHIRFGSAICNEHMCRKNVEQKLIAVSKYV